MEKFSHEPVQVVFEGGSTRGKEEWRIFWENGMQHPILVAGRRAWLLSYQGGRLVCRLICDTVPTDALLSFAAYNEKNGIFVLGTNSKGIIIIRKNSVRPVKEEKPYNG